MATFAQQIDKFAKKANTSIENAVKAIRIQVVSGIIYRTPVLDGSLVQSWIASIGSSTDEKVDTSNPSGAKEKAIAKAVKIAQTDIDSVFWMTNNQPYVRRIEYEGHSSIKAPQGMVRITLKELEVGLERLIKNV